MKYDRARKGGLSALMAERLGTTIVEEWKLMVNRIHWTRLRRLLGGDLGVANVYAPNNPKDRYCLWDEMVKCLPKDCRWIFVGDWNMVEARKNKLTIVASLCHNLKNWHWNKCWSTCKWKGLCLTAKEGSNFPRTADGKMEQG